MAALHIKSKVRPTESINPSPSGRGLGGGLRICRNLDPHPTRFARRPLFRHVSSSSKHYPEHKPHRRSQKQDCSTDECGTCKARDPGCFRIATLRAHRNNLRSILSASLPTIRFCARSRIWPQRTAWMSPKMRATRYSKERKPERLMRSYFPRSACQS